MQNKDALSIEYFKDKRRIADLLNGYLFEGKQILRPEHVTELNRSVSRIAKKGTRLGAQMLFRDLMHEISVNFQVVLVALENQSDIHYAMPVRVMNADAVSYEEQLREKRKEHKQRKDLEGAEYLSGFAKEDQLSPIISIVLYFGKKEWDGARNLKGMLNLAALPDSLQKFVADYPMNLLAVRKYVHLDYFQTDLQYVFGFLQKEDDGDKLEQYVEENQKEFSELEEDAYDLISVMSHSSELQDVKANYQQEEGGRINMCQAIRQLIERGEARGEARGEELGEIQGIKLAKQVLAYSRMDMSLELIAQNCGVSVEKVKMILDL